MEDEIMTHYEASSNDGPYHDAIGRRLRKMYANDGGIMPIVEIRRNETGGNHHG